MRKIIVEAEMSIDGCMGGENVEFWGHTGAYRSEDVTKYLQDLLFTPDALLIGRKTFEFFAMVWPTREGADADHINTMPKYVASKTLEEPLAWNGTLIKGDVGEAIAKLKQESGKELVQYGIGELTQTMLQHGLVDEIRLLVFPFAFGQGPRVFEHFDVASMKLIYTHTFESGVVALHYAPENGD
jgi:dihydrofolate reductase